MHNQLDLIENVEENRAKDLLNDYLEQITGPLVYDIPYADRELIRAEIRGHVEALASAHMEVGDDPAEAMAAALRQFGSPIKIGRSLLRERTAGTRHNRLLSTFGGLIGATAGMLVGNLIGLYLVRIGMVTYSGLPVDYSWSGGIGFLSGWAIFRRRMGAIRAAFHGGKVYGMAMAISMVIVSLLSGKPGFWFAGTVTVSFALGGLAVGAIIGGLRPRVERVLREIGVPRLKA